MSTPVSEMAEDAAAASRQRPEPAGRVERVVASAPGKLILIGEHAAVYGRPALVAALGRRTTVNLERRPGRDAELDLVTLDHRESVSWPEILDYCETKRSEWRRFSEDPHSFGIERVVGDEPAHLVRLALGETMRELAVEPPGVRLGVSSEIPVGAGFGSSASVAVAVIGALFELLGQPLEPARISRIALDVERRQHGRPSGVDHSTVLAGGLLRLEPGSDGLDAVPLDAAPERLEELVVFHTGSPAESTGTVVAAVRGRRDRDRDRFDALLDRMEAATRRFETGLRDPRSSAPLRDAMRGFEGCLEELEVVPDAVASVVRRVEAAGGAAKVSGAGTLSQQGAGALLVCAPQREVEDLLSGYRRFETREDRVIGAPGLTIEDRR